MIMKTRFLSSFLLFYLHVNFIVEARVIINIITFDMEMKVDLWWLISE